MHALYRVLGCSRCVVLLKYCCVLPTICCVDVCRVEGVLAAVTNSDSSHSLIVYISIGKVPERVTLRVL